MQLNQNPNKTYTTFKFRPVTVNEMFKFLKKLKRKKASAIDNLPPGFLKDTAFNIVKPLKHLINLCLSTAKMPKAFKIGKITPLFKKWVKTPVSQLWPSYGASNTFKSFSKLHPFSIDEPT